MKRELNRGNRKQQTLALSVLTVTACAEALQPPLLLSRQPNTSLTLRGELTAARRSKRPVLVIVRRSNEAVGGRVFSDGPALKVVVSLPPSLFADALALALSGHLAGVEVTTEKLMPTASAVVGVRFATGELRSAGSAGVANAPSSSRATATRKTARIPPPKRRHP
jgi:hypothetical protein